MRKGNALYSACTSSLLWSSPRQIGPICAWSSGNVARVMAEHNGGYSQVTGMTRRTRCVITGYRWADGPLEHRGSVRGRIGRDG